MRTTSHRIRIALAALAVAAAGLGIVSPPAHAVVTGTTPVSVLITSSQNPADTGANNSVTITVTVTKTGTGGDPGGTVDVKFDGTAFPGSPFTLSTTGGITTASTTAKTDFASGAHVITADYSGDPTYAPTSAAPKLQDVSATPLVLRTWVGSATDTKWSTPSNWTPTGVPLPTDTVVFPDATNATALDMSFEVAYVSITGPGRTIGGGSANTLTVDKAVHDDSTGGSVLDVKLAPGATPSPATNLLIDGTVTAQQAISGAAATTVQTYGRNIFKVANSYAGPTHVDGGTLTPLTATSLGSTAGATAVASGASLKLPAFLSTAEPLTLSGTGFAPAGTGALDLGASANATGLVTLAADSTVTNSSNASIGGVVAGTSKLTKAGAGTLSLPNVNTLTGGLAVSEGTVSTDNASGFGASANVVTVATGARVNVAAAVNIPNPITAAGGSTISTTAKNGQFSGTISLSGVVTATSTATLTSTNALILSGKLTGTGSLTKAGTGEVQVQNSTANNLGGPITATAGLLQLGNSAAPAVSAPNGLSVTGGETRLQADDLIGDSAPVTVSSGALLDALGFSDTIGSLTSNGAVNLGVFGSANSVMKMGTLSLTGGSLLVDVEGTTPGTDQDQIQATNVTVGGSLIVQGDLPYGTTITLVDNQGPNPVTGTFAGLPEGASVGTDTKAATISYKGGNGNDITLTERPARSGYWMVGSDGTVYRFGDAVKYGDLTQFANQSPAVDIEPTTDFNGYWILTANGSVFSFGDAPFHGSAAGKLGSGEIATSISNDGSNSYWVFTNKGRALPFGTAGFFHDMSGVPLNGPVVGSVGTPTGEGYYMVGGDGGMFAFGDAQYYGSMGGHPLNKPVVGVVSKPDLNGYWLVAGDGGLFNFGSPEFHGSMGGQPLNKPVVGMVAYGNAYLMVAADGGIFNFATDKTFAGSLGSNPPANPIVNVAALNESD